MIKVILPANEIPLDSIVTKRTGEKEYILKDRMRVFGREQGQDGEVVAKDGCRFLVKDGDANVVSPDTELVWLVDEGILSSFLYAYINGGPQ